MLQVTCFDAVHRIGLFLSESRYHAAGITQQLRLSEGLRADLSNLPIVLKKTEGESVLPLLARLFFVGWPAPVELCRRLVPEPILAAARECGLLIENKDAGEFEAQAMLVPFADFLVACDSPRLAARHHEKVVGPGRATLALARAALRGHNETTLDIGSGSGVLSIAATSYSGEVTGTDLSPRARNFGEFSAALNGKRNAQFLCGDGLETVKGRVFSRILANPPFFLGPVKTFTFCDSPLELDGFSRRLAQEAPSHLRDGGYFQMISEWVEIKGEKWPDRLREWTAHSGCDVLVNIASVLTATQYAEKRFDEAQTLFGERKEESFQNHLDYFAEHQVENVLLGIVTMRKRAGKNWFSVLPSCPVTAGIPEAIEERFDTLTFAGSHSAEQLLATRFRLAPDAGIDQRIVPTTKGWGIQRFDLLKTGPFEDRLSLDASVAGIVPLFDGKLTLDEIAVQLSQQASLEAGQARQNCVQLCQRLLESGLVQAL